MLKYGNKEFRNLQEQVLENMDNIKFILEEEGVLNEFGIKVVGQETSVEDLPESGDEYGDAYAIGTEPPYELYIWTRANATHPEDYWFNIGEFPKEGPQGEQGIQGIQGLRGNTGATTVAIQVVKQGTTGEGNEYYLKHTMSDGRTINSSTFISPKGDNGESGYSIYFTEENLSESEEYIYVSDVTLPSGKTILIGDLIISVNGSIYSVINKVSTRLTLSYLSTITSSGTITPQTLATILEGSATVVVDENESGTKLVVELDQDVIDDINGKASIDSLSDVAFSGDYDDLSNPPTASDIYATNAQSVQTNLERIDERIDDLSNIGRFLSLWNALTGLPATDPETLPYEYHTGDYYRVTVGGDRIPDGTEYGGLPSTTTGEIAVGDVWYFDGSDWVRQINQLPEIPVEDVQINGTSIVSDSGVANIPKGSDSTFGVFKIAPGSFGIGDTNGILMIIPASNNLITNKSTERFAITPKYLDKAIMEGLGNNSLTWTTAYKQNARNTIGAGTPLDVQIGGTSIVSSGVANIPKATTSVLGVVKPDGTTITVNNNGVISAVGGGGGGGSYHIEELKTDFYGLSQLTAAQLQTITDYTVTFIPSSGDPDHWEDYMRITFSLMDFLDWVQYPPEDANGQFKIPCSINYQGSIDDPQYHGWLEGNTDGTNVVCKYQKWSDAMWSFITVTDYLRYQGNNYLSVRRLVNT